jgi:hypothetical protein
MRPREALKNAIDLVNETRRGPRDPPLLVLAQCQGCGGAFAQPANLAGRIAASGGKLPTLCRLCALDRRRASRRVGGR